MRRRAPALEKKLKDNHRLLTQWRRWHAEQLAEALASPHAQVVAGLLEILRGLELRSGPALLSFIRAQDWRAVDADTRFIILHEINAAIVKLRERAGMTPLDDPLDERLNVFQRAKALLFPA